MIFKKISVRYTDVETEVLLAFGSMILAIERDLVTGWSEGRDI